MLSEQHAIDSPGFTKTILDFESIIDRAKGINIMEEKKEKKFKEYRISELMASAEIIDNPDLYVNHAQFMVTNSEIVIDLYKISPLQGNDFEVKSERVQRLYLPHSLGKGFVEALANVINNFEEDNNVKLINNRKRAPRDKIKVWDDNNNK